MYVFCSRRHGRRWGEWMRVLGLGFTTNPEGTGGVLDVCLYLGLRWGVVKAFGWVG